MKTQQKREKTRLRDPLRARGVASNSKRLALALFGATLLSAGLGAGCARSQYRADADSEVYGLLNTVDKSDSEKYWELNGFTLQESNCSRYANRYDPDAQPSPIDDCTAGRLLSDVEGPKGVKKWTKNGFTASVENQNWRNTLPAPNENGEIVLDQKAAFDLALLHSPQYRSALENVYLAALNVTAERYAFDTKFYGGSSLFYRNNGGFKDGTHQLSLQTIDAGAQRRLATGATVVTELANSMVWTFSPGNQTMVPTTTLSYAITQPFLRGAGRAIVLESLTRSERRLLANVRQLAFYQQGFYVGVLTGSSPVQAPSSGGYPGSGVGGAQVGGFYGLLSSQIQILNQESNVASSADNYQRYEEYFATSRITNRTDVDRMRQNWLNSQKNLIELKDSYRDSVESYLMDLGLPPDVENVVVRDPLLDQFVLMPTTLENFQNDVATLLGWLRNKNNEVVGSSERRYVNSIDDLKGKEGQVTRVSVADLRAIFSDFDAQFAAGLKETNDDVENLENNVRPRRQAALETIRARFEAENPELDSSFADYRLFDERVATIREDLDRAKEELSDSGVVLKARGAKYNLAKIFELINQTVLAYSPDELAEMILLRREDPNANPFPSTVTQLVSDVHMESELNDPNQFNADEIEAELAQLEIMSRNLTDENRAEYIARKTSLEKSLSNLRSGSLMRADVYRIWFSSCLTKLSEELMTLRLIQARARLETIELATVDVDSEEAFQVARERRLDWMNVRSNLVDQWRNIEIVADQLRSDMSVQVGGSIQNEGSNPVNFSSKRAQFTAGITFDAPLDRFLERNSYRQALISYDQARRNYYSYVDGVHQQIRSSIRAIELAQISFELQRDSVLTSIKRVHTAQLDLTKPPTGSSRVGTVNTSAEALTNALESLLNSQNEIMRTWLQYQSRRMNLMLMLGVFNLDRSGRWIDPGNIDRQLLITYMSDVERSQDELAGIQNLPTVEQLSGGRSAEALREMGDSDGEAQETATAVASESSESSETASNDAAPNAQASADAPRQGYATSTVLGPYAGRTAPYAESVYAARDEEILQKRAQAAEMIDELEDEPASDAAPANDADLSLFELDEDAELNPNVAILGVENDATPPTASPRSRAYGAKPIVATDAPKR